MEKARYSLWVGTREEDLRQWVARDGTKAWLLSHARRRAVRMSRWHPMVVVAPTKKEQESGISGRETNAQR